MHGSRNGGVILGLTALLAGALVLAVLPFTGSAAPEVAGGVATDVQAGGSQATAAGEPAAARLLRIEPDLRALRDEERLRDLRRALSAAPREQEQDPKTEPPMHGTNPHGQGTVGVVDVAPDPTRPQGGNPDGSDSGEEVVVGRARGEQREDGTYHGHVTIVALFGQEILGVDTDPGETQNGPLNAIQTGVLDALCTGSGQQVCLSVVRADSSTDGNGSTNHFSAAHAKVGGANGIEAGAAESNGNISSDGTCQTSHGDSSVASVRAGGQAVADVARSSTDSRACRGEAPTQTNDSRVVALGGTGVPLPDPGCANGTADVVTGVPVVAPVVCNGDDTNTQGGPGSGVREALAVWVLDAGGSQLLKTTTGASESKAVAPRAPQCSDGTDNDGDGKVDAADPGCLSGPGGAYNPNDDNEADEPKPQCSDMLDNDGDGHVDAADPHCLSGPGGTYNPADDNEAGATSARGGGGDGGDTGRPECSDRRDNDGDGRVDARDPGCLSGPGDTYNPNDDDESDGGDGPPECSDAADNDGDDRIDRDDPGCLSGPGGTYDPNDDSEADARREAGASLARTGADAILIAIGGLLLIAGGIALRRRAELGIPA